MKNAILMILVFVAVSFGYDFNVIFNDSQIKINSMLKGGTVYLAAAERYILRSEDGITWAGIDFGTDNGVALYDFSKIASDGGNFFVLGEKKSGPNVGFRDLWVSGNGIGWYNLSFAGVTLHKGCQNILVGFNGGVLISDGMDLYKIVYFNNTTINVKKYTLEVAEIISDIMYVSENEIFITTTNGSILKISQPSLIKESNVNLGNNSLLNNYPNPFNPITTIKFTILKDGLARLTVFNSKGEIVNELINSEFKAGNHTVNFDGSKLNSGIYFYKLETNDKVSIEKMILVK